MRIIRKIFGNSAKNNRTLALPAPAPTPESNDELRARLIEEKFSKALFGDKCRSSIFHDTGLLNDYKYYLAQSVSPQNDRWNIMLITDREQNVDGQVKRVRNYTLEAENKHFFETVEYLAQREAQIRAHQNGTIDETTLAAQDFAGLSIPHFRPFAEQEGVLFKTDHMPEPSLNGAIVIAGAYDMDAVRVEDQVNRALELNREWTKTILDFTDQRLNSKAPFEMIVSTREHDVFYHRAARSLDWMIETLDLRLASPDFRLTEDIAKKQKEKIDDVKTVYILDLALGSDTVNDSLEYSVFYAAPDKIKSLPLFPQIENMCKLLSLLEFIAHYKMAPKHHKKTARDAGAKVENYGRHLKFSAPEIETLKAFLLTDAKVVIPPHARQFSAQLTQFAQQHTKLLAAMEQELLQPDAKIGEDRMKDYVKRRPQQMLEFANFTFTAETIDGKNKAAVAYVKEQNKISAQNHHNGKGGLTIQI